ncbi:hypothetical protein [Yersinia wautersii]|uniref:hypothetical protein n=1 Tax=Yersinia wautersii TaxID=1341643 RepID=UPI0005B4EE38|nr:hypothetical protein [Yersinia wautersii]
MAGKIAFIFPMIMESYLSGEPKLNFIISDDTLRMRAGVSFIELSPEKSYFILLKLLDKNGVDILDIPSNMLTQTLSGMPPEQIHPVMRTSFLNARISTKVKEYGTYKLTCELYEGLVEPCIDLMSIYFNVFKDDNYE